LGSALKIENKQFKTTLIMSIRENKVGKMRSGHMGKKIFDRIKKTICILMLVFFVSSVTVASVSAASQKTDNQWGNEKKQWENEQNNWEKEQNNWEKEQNNWEKEKRNWDNEKQKWNNKKYGDDYKK
jgi:preprotein translocase subunit SecG